MKNNKLNYLIVVFFITCFVFSCKTIKKSDRSCFVNYQDRQSCYSNRAQYLSCLKITEKTYTDYILFELTSESTESLDLAIALAEKNIKIALVARLKKNMENKIKVSVYDVWDMNKITLPVNYQHFYKEKSDKIVIKSIAVFLRDQADPISFLKYLPLEYKLPFLEKMELMYKKNHN